MEKTGGKFMLQWETHSKQQTRSLCMLMERQCLVDVAICCGNNTMHAHKCILAANSIYFKEHLENKSIEQIIIHGLDFSVMKAIIEFIYSGECVIPENHLRHYIAAVKLFRITALENIFSENEYQNIAADEVCMPPPQFICKPPKYPTVYKPFNSAPLSPKVSYPLNNVYKMKRKCLGSEAEKACAKEAQASRIALANLRKVMANTPQVHSFIVEESFNETTVENFIPTGEENYNEVQFVNGNLQNGGAAGNDKTLNVIPVSLSGNTTGLTADKIKHILGNDEVEIMFQTSDGNFVNVSDEVLLNLSKSGLQYQVVDENGQVGELQELKSLDSDQQQNKTGNLEFAARKTGAQHPEILGHHKNPHQEEEKLPKSIHEEYVASCNKNTLESLQLQSQFNEGLYENSFNTSEIFEPENLSIHGELMGVDQSMTFNELKYKYVSSDKSGGGDAMDIDTSIEYKNTIHESKTLKEPEQSSSSSMKFTPDMFFADLADTEPLIDKSGENDPALTKISFN